MGGPLSGGRKVAIVGFMGAGKTTAGRLAARALSTDCLDADAELERRLGRSIPELFSAGGEEGFRAAEERLVLELLRRPEAGLLALGGGAVTSEAVRRELEGHVTIWLDVEPELAWGRCCGSGRPLATDRSTFERLHAEREPLYRAVARVTIGQEGVAEIGAAVREACAMPPGARMLWARGGSCGYPAFIGAGLLEPLRFWPESVRGRRFLVTDGNAGRLHSHALEPYAGRVVIMPGEQSKTIANSSFVWSELARAGMTRSDVVVALGGGVVGDLAGFCAATYQRGVRCVQVPTTLVAQVDSAYGGKTGVDLEQAKNYVGAYHHPRAVLTDPGVLATLPEAELAAGYAEVVKTALIAGGDLWERVRSGADPVDPLLIEACAHTKLRIVARDERDGGPRQALNLGHTVAHAIETVTGYAAYRHGEAVALGLLAALRLSGRDQLRAEVAELLASRGLPIRMRDVDPAAVVMATARDKKRVGSGGVPFVLLEAPGRPLPGSPVGDRELIAAVRELAG